MSTAVSLQDLSGIGYAGFNSASLPAASIYRNNAASQAGYPGDSTFFSSEALTSPQNPGAGADALSSFSSAWGLNSGNSLTSLSGTLAADPLSSALEALYQKTLASAMLRMVTSLVGSLCGVNGLTGLNNALNNNQNNNAIDNGNLNNGGNAVDNGGNAVNNNGNNNATQQGIIDEAKTWLGTPYVYGGTSRSGVDCSGFVQNVFKAKGINLPRVTTDQVKQGKEVSRNQLQPGDLVFFHNNGHVGIYIGNGQYIHSPHTGDKVKISSLAGADISACRRVL
ncbi:MAG: C40 family peptidase [Vulcanimicrobiota bacterium]